MTTRKNNSIIFLTTLGVYLGLVLVGGAVPQVFAHGALTRPFELQDEIEAADDLDDKPDHQDSTASNPQRHEAKFLSYAQTLSSMLRAERPPEGFNFTARSYTTTAGDGVTISLDQNPVLFGIGERAQLESDVLALLSISRRLSTVSLDRFLLTWTADAEVISITSTLVFQTELDSFHGFVSLSRERDLAVSSSLGEAAKAILKATELKRSTNEVLIVTRLPRAALDPLLAKDAK